MWSHHTRLLPVLIVVATACRPCAPGQVTRELRLSFTAKASTPPFTLEVLRPSLDGGPSTIVVPVPDGVPATLSLWIRAGSDHEAHGEAGAAHLTRHILMNSGRYPEVLAALTASGGTVEVWTSRRFTVVTVHAPPGELDTALEILGPFLRPPGADEDTLLGARKSVEREADEWWSEPAATARDALHSLMLGPERAASLFPDIGILGETGPDSLASFIERNYRSGRMVLAAAIPKSATPRLSSLPAPRTGGGGEAAEATSPEEPFTRVLALADPTGAGGAQGKGGSLVLAGVTLPHIGSEQGGAAHLLARWLGRRGPGTVHEHLTELTGTFETLSTALDATGEDNLLSITATAPPGGEIEAVQAMASALALTHVIGPQGPALERAALGTSISWMMDLKNPLLAPARLARYEHISQGIPLEDHLSRLFEVQAQEVTAITEGFLRPGAVGFVLVQATAQGHDQPEAIEPEAIDAAAAAAIEETLELAGRAAKSCGKKGSISAATSKDGVRVAALRTPGSGAVAITGLIGAGSLHETPGREGTAKLLSLLMAKKLALAVRLSPGLDPDFVTSSAVYQPDHVGVNLVVPEDRWLEGVLAVRSALLRPPFTTKLFEEARQKCIALSHASPDPKVMGTRAVLGELIGLEKGYNPEGTVSSLGTLTPGEVRKFHHAALERDAVVSIAGEVQAAEACTASAVAFRPIFAAGEAGAISLMAPAPAVSTQATQPVLTQGSGPVAWITAAWTTPGLTGEDHLAVEVIARLLDGPDGPLAGTVIGDKGLATSIEVDTWATAGWGVLVVRIQAPATNVDAVIEALASSIAGLRDDVPARDEIEAAATRVLVERMQALALPDSAARLLALETLRGSSGSGQEVEKTLAKMGPNRVVEAAESWLMSAAPAISVLAP